MKIIFDTNALFPAWIYLNGVCAKALRRAIGDKKISVVICTHTLEELLRNCNKKFPREMTKLQAFLIDILEKAELIKTPPESEKTPEEDLIRDTDDRPLLRAALAANADIIITGDKDFLEAPIKKPRILTPAEFIKLENL
ncbi:MAG: putative toxin-antitoxin system toxin component, PIN family [Oscillospiraceae bacterium]|nr:putative toxin-antitoxin system toxin component, PIN family [Oscillospiraceae bacterium]